MAIAVDASSPAIVTANNPASPTTASFTPPGSALLVALVGSNQLSAQTTIDYTFSSTGVTGLTWTLIAKRDNAENGVTNSAAAGIYVAQLPASVQAMTVTVTIANMVDPGWMALYVVTGADVGTAAIGASSEGGASTANPVTSSLTAQQTGSLLFVAASEWNANGNPTSSTLIVQDFSNAALSAVGGYRTMSAAGSGTSWDYTSPAAPVWTWVAAEIRAPAGGAPTVQPWIPIRIMQVP